MMWDLSADVALYLSGKLTLDQLNRSTDAVVDDLTCKQQGGPLWGFATYVEGLICEHVYGHTDEATFRKRLGEML